MLQDYIKQYLMEKEELDRENVRSTFLTETSTSIYSSLFTLLGDELRFGLLVTASLTSIGTAAQLQPTCT